MNKILNLIGIIFLLVSVFKPVIADNCEPSVDLFYSLVALDQDDTNQLSKYGYPDFREDDVLIISGMLLKNNASCASPELELTSNIFKPDGTQKQFCQKLVLPSIKPYSHLVLNDTFLIKNTDSKYIARGFFYNCITTLDDEGDWQVQIYLDPKNKEDSLNIFSTGVIHKGILGPNKFKVYSKHMFTQIDLSKKSMNYAAAGIIFGFIGAIVAAFFGACLTYLTGRYQDKCKEQKRKKEAIKALLYEINKNVYLGKEILSKKEIYLKNHKVPFDNFIMLNLEKVLRGNYIEKANLLNDLFDYYGYLFTLNSFLERLRLPNLPKEITDMNKIIDGLEDKNTIKTIAQLIKKLDKEIKKR